MLKQRREKQQEMSLVIMEQMVPGTTTKMQSMTDPDSGQQSREGKPDGFHYSEHRTVDSKCNVIVNVHVEPANLNDVTSMSGSLKEIEARLGRLPQYMGLDAGYHNAWIAHLWKARAYKGSSATDGTRMPANMTGNIDSDRIRSSTSTSVLSTNISTGKPPSGRATANISATAKPAPLVHDEQRASVSV